MVTDLSDHNDTAERISNQFKKKGIQAVLSFGRGYFPDFRVESAGSSELYNKRDPMRIVILI